MQQAQIHHPEAGAARSRAARRALPTRWEEERVGSSLKRTAFLRTGIMGLCLYLGLLMNRSTVHRHLPKVERPSDDCRVVPLFKIPVDKRERDGERQSEKT
jgi:hypothetical protein